MLYIVFYIALWVKSVNNNNNDLRKCKLLDWCGTGNVDAEGRWSSSDPKVLVHHVSLGPQAVKVWVDLPIKDDVFLWRPNSEMTYIEDAIGSTAAWPSDKVLISTYILLEDFITWYIYIFL